MHCKALARAGWLELLAWGGGGSHSFAIDWGLAARLTAHLPDPLPWPTLDDVASLASEAAADAKVRVRVRVRVKVRVRIRVSVCVNFLPVVGRPRLGLGLVCVR